MEEWGRIGHIDVHAVTHFTNKVILRNLHQVLYVGKLRISHVRIYEYK